jgi:hypothetical protein
LNNIEDIRIVLPRPNQTASIAFAYLQDERKVPNIDEWREQLREIDSGTYTLRGIELTLIGYVKEIEGQLILEGTSAPGGVLLNQFTAQSKLEWDNAAKVSEPLTQEEAIAYTDLFKTVVAQPNGLELHVTGRLQKDGDKYSLDVKSFTEHTAPA